MNLTELQAILGEIRNSGLFAEDWYRKTYKDYLAAADDPLKHYLEKGAEIGLDPSPKFSTQKYLKLYQDVSAAQMNPLVHYIKSGRREGRSPIGIEEQKNDGPSTGQMRLPRFGGREYGPVEHVLSFDRVVDVASRVDPKLCVHVHLFHQEMWNEFVAYLHNIPCRFTLLISICSDSSINYPADAIQKLPHLKSCIVKRVENRGRDVAPWVVDFCQEILDHELFVHLHSKRSDYNSNYAGWRRFLLHNTLGRETICAQILNLFYQESSLGLVYPPYFSALPNQPRWGANQNRVDGLLSNMGFKSMISRCPDYPAGSFFWARVKSIEPLLKMGLRHSDFEPELGQIDGTLGHAIERLLGVLPQAAGFQKKCVGVDVAYNLINYWDSKRAQLIESAASKVIKEPNTYPRGSRATCSFGRVAVFTCITGGFDEFVPPTVIEDGVDYFIYSDISLPASPPYKQVECRYVDVNSRRTARFVKTHPHFYLRDYDFSVWVDGNIVPTAGILKYVTAVIESEADLGLIAHPIRSSYVDEAEECIRIKADDPTLIEEQKRVYLTEGIPEKDLIETNVIVSHLKSPRVGKFYDIWWREMSRYSLRDQISVNKALSESGAKYMFILDRGLSVRDAEGFCITSHDLRDRRGIVSHVINRGAAFEKRTY